MCHVERTERTTTGGKKVVVTGLNIQENPGIGEKAKEKTKVKEEEKEEGKGRGEIVELTLMKLIRHLRLIMSFLNFEMSTDQVAMMTKRRWKIENHMFIHYDMIIGHPKRYLTELLHRTSTSE